MLKGEHLSFKEERVKSKKRLANKRKIMNAQQTGTSSEGQFGHVVQESLLVGMLVVLAFLMITLISYQPEDPGFSYLGSNPTVANAGGRVGAWIADVSLSLFGYFAYVFPLLLTYRIVQALRKRHEEDPQPWTMAMLLLKSAGLILLLLSGAGITALHFEANYLPNGSGGILGLEIAHWASHTFNVLGANLILLAVCLMALTLILHISWRHVVENVVNGLSFIARAFWVGLQGQWQSLSRTQVKEIQQPLPLKVAKPKVKPALPAKNQRELAEPFFNEANLENDEIRQPVAIPIIRTAREPINQPMPTAMEKPRLAVNKELGNKESANKKPLKIAEFPKPAELSQRAQKEKQRSLFAAEPEGPLPAISLLDPPPPPTNRGFSQEQLQSMSRLLELKLRDFNIEAEVVAVIPGPVVTRFEIQPAPGIKVSRITNLAKDLARSLAVVSVRVVEVIPGKTVVGIEIPNQEREAICLSEVLSSKAYDQSKSPLTLCLGKDIAGQPTVADLGKMPHLLVAGTTGSGKSVGLNVMLASMLFKATPAELRMIMIDPKMLELSIYDDIPHLLAPVVTDMKEAANALRWCVAEMERRYKLMAAMGVRNLAGFNRKILDGQEAGEPLTDPLWKAELSLETQPPELTTLPYIVVVIDEFADMIMIVGKKVEELIARIAQKARAAGIHLILATQRPSVDVITGLIKANIPSRIAFQVSSKIDSRTILDQGGAEQLLGYGDMLYLPPGTSLPIRIHGAFLSDEEVHRICNDWRARAKPDYLQEIIDGAHESGSAPGFEPEGMEDSEQDPLYDEAVRFITETRRVSVSSVQRKLKIGYNRAARMVEAMEMAGVVSELQGSGLREVLAPPPI